MGACVLLQAHKAQTMGTSHKGNPEEQSQIQTPTAFTYRLQHP
jgi:hypothetical protein